jgi:protease I
LAETAIDQVRPEQFDALFIPGGHSPDHLRAHRRMVAFTKAFFDASKPVFAIWSRRGSPATSPRSSGNR